MNGCVHAHTYRSGKKFAFTFPNHFPSPPEMDEPGTHSQSKYLWQHVLLNADKNHKKIGIKVQNDNVTKSVTQSGYFIIDQSVVQSKLLILLQSGSDIESKSCLAIAAEQTVGELHPDAAAEKSRESPR